MTSAAIVGETRYFTVPFVVKASTKFVNSLRGRLYTYAMNAYRFVMTLLTKKLVRVKLLHPQTFCLDCQHLPRSVKHWMNMSLARPRLKRFWLLPFTTITNACERIVSKAKLN